jgi:hypothetical protein
MPSADQVPVNFPRRLPHVRYTSNSGAKADIPAFRIGAKRRDHSSLNRLDRVLRLQSCRRDMPTFCKTMAATLPSAGELSDK